MRKAGPTRTKVTKLRKFTIDYKTKAYDPFSSHWEATCIRQVASIPLPTLKLELVLDWRIVQWHDGINPCVALYLDDASPGWFNTYVTVRVLFSEDPDSGKVCCFTPKSLLRTLVSRSPERVVSRESITIEVIPQDQLPSGFSSFFISESPIICAEPLLDSYDFKKGVSKVNEMLSCVMECMPELVVTGSFIQNLVTPLSDIDVKLDSNVLPSNAELQRSLPDFYVHERRDDATFKIAILKHKDSNIRLDIGCKVVNPIDDTIAVIVKELGVTFRGFVIQMKYIFAKLDLLDSSKHGGTLSSCTLVVECISFVRSDMIVDLANETIWSLSWKFLNFLVHGRSLSIIDATVNGPRYILGGLAEKLAKYSGSQRVQWMTEDPNEPRVNLGRSVSKDALVISRLSAFVKHLTTDDYFQMSRFVTSCPQSSHWMRKRVDMLERGTIATLIKTWLPMWAVLCALSLSLASASTGDLVYHLDNANDLIQKGPVYSHYHGMVDKTTQVRVKRVNTESDKTKESLRNELRNYDKIRKAVSEKELSRHFVAIIGVELSSGYVMLEDELPNLTDIIALVFEACPIGSLASALKSDSISLTTALWHMQHLAEAVSVLHDNDLLGRFGSLENVMICNIYNNERLDYVEPKIGNYEAIIELDSGDVFTHTSQLQGYIPTKEACADYIEHFDVFSLGMAVWTATETNQAHIMSVYHDPVVKCIKAVSKRPRRECLMRRLMGMQIIQPRRVFPRDFGDFYDRTVELLREDLTDIIISAMAPVPEDSHKYSAKDMVDDLKKARKHLELMKNRSKNQKGSTELTGNDQ